MRLLYLTALALFISTAAMAAPKCGPSLQILQALDRFGESIHEQHQGPGADGLPVDWVLWVNAATGSWTLTGTRGVTTCAFIGATSGYAGQRIADFLQDTPT